MKTVFAFLATIEAAFISLKIGLCEHYNLAESNELTLRFERQCSTHSEYKVKLNEGIKTEFYQLPGQIEMEELHKLSIEWSGNSALCLTDLILQASDSKIQLLESFPRDSRESRRAWFASDCASKSSWSRGAIITEKEPVKSPELYRETCSKRRFFHFVRFSLQLCEPSMLRGRLPWDMKYEANVPETLEENSFWTNVKTRWNYDGNSTWIKLIGATDEDWNAAFTEIDSKSSWFCHTNNTFRTSKLGQWNLFEMGVAQQSAALQAISKLFYRCVKIHWYVSH